MRCARPDQSDQTRKPENRKSENRKRELKMRCARPDQSDQTRDRKCEKGGMVGSNTI